MALQKKDAFLVIFGHANEGTGQFGLGRIGHPNGLSTAFKDGGVASGDTKAEGHFWLALRIDKFHRNLWAGLPIAVEPFFIGLITRVFFAREDGDFHVARKVANHPVGLRRE